MQVWFVLIYSILCSVGNPRVLQCYILYSCRVFIYCMYVCVISCIYFCVCMVFINIIFRGVGHPRVLQCYILYSCRVLIHCMYECMFSWFLCTYDLYSFIVFSTVWAIKKAFKLWSSVLMYCNIYNTWVHVLYILYRCIVIAIYFLGF